MEQEASEHKSNVREGKEAAATGNKENEAEKEDLLKTLKRQRS